MSTFKTPLYSIVLAAGRGRRMGQRDRHKVCFEIAGVSAIVRALDAYNRVGVTQNVVVVGQLAGQVVETVGRRFSNVTFAYQPEANGTGDAAERGLQALASLDDAMPILVVAGDKLVSSAALHRLVSRFEQSQSDLLFLASKSANGDRRTAGRVLLDTNQRPLAIVETRQARQRAARRDLYHYLSREDSDTVPRARLDEIVRGRLGNGDSLTDLCDLPSLNQNFSPGRPDSPVHVSRPALLAQLETLPDGFSFRQGGEKTEEMYFSPEEVLSSPLRNESVYLIRKGALAYGLQRMPVDHDHPGERYLTDGIGAILDAVENGAPRFQVGIMIEDRDEVLSYNDPNELLHVEARFRNQEEVTLMGMERKLGPHRLRRVAEWLEMFDEDAADSGGPEVDAALQAYYGATAETLKDRRHAFRDVLNAFKETFGSDRRAILVRSPGRINIMGRHIDWQGGCCNLMAVNQEVVMVAAPRDDDMVHIRNVDAGTFPDVSFSVGQMVSQLDWDDWLNTVNCRNLERHLRQASGNWNLYVEAAVLRLQMAFRDQVLRGMDVVVSGNIPVAAGLSSSSALVVSTAEAVVALHGLDVTPRQFVNFCGEGEWFVGTRGGSADHAAMKYGAKGTISHVKFHDFELLEQLSFPDSHLLVVCNSFMQAKKAAGAKAAFNSRVASYRLGVELVRRRFPQYAPFVQYVRDINPETLHISLDKIYEILLQLPESMTAAEVRKELQHDPECWQPLEPFFADAEPDTAFPVRGVVWFGISECARARKAAELLRSQDMRELGNLMNISHDGERRFDVDDQLKARPFAADISEARLRQLIADARSSDEKRRAAAALAQQPGAYTCSIQEIDAIVDIANRTPGVVGAQIAGAGLGGCAMVLVEAEAADQLEQRLLDHFYRPRGLDSGVIRCTPSAGSCVVEVGSA